MFRARTPDGKTLSVVLTLIMVIMIAGSVVPCTGQEQKSTQESNQNLAQDDTANDTAEPEMALPTDVFPDDAANTPVPEDGKEDGKEAGRNNGKDNGRESTKDNGRDDSKDDIKDDSEDARGIDGQNNSGSGSLILTPPTLDGPVAKEHPGEESSEESQPAPEPPLPSAEPGITVPAEPNVQPSNEPGITAPAEPVVQPANEPGITVPAEPNIQPATEPGITAPAEPVVQPEQPLPLPNIVLMVVKDVGFGDLSCFLGKQVKTPNLDRLARSGLRFADFSVPIADDSSSLRALLTGTRFSNKLQQTNLALLLKSKGYTTAFLGQWYPGASAKNLMPGDCGFDYFWGITQPVDHWSWHPTMGDSFPPLKLYENDRIVGYNTHPGMITNQIADLTLEQLRNARNSQSGSKPCFVYASFTAAHVPLTGSARFSGQSLVSDYYDVIMELDAAVGRIIAELDRLKQRENTWIIFVSDSGPWLSYGEHAGSAGPLREGKGTYWEGGLRVPCIMSWPAVIPEAGVYSRLATTLDIFPTITDYVDVNVPTPMEGQNLRPVFEGDLKTAVNNSFVYYNRKAQVMAVRIGNWKVLCPQTYRTLAVAEPKTNTSSERAATPGTNGNQGMPRPYLLRQIDWSLYDLSNDLTESHDLSGEKPEVLKSIRNALQKLKVKQ